MKAATAFTLLLALGPALPARAALQWENKVIVIDAEPLAEQATATFHFTNTGTTTATITNTHASCGCTTPALDQREYAPGESGELRVVYAFGEATGHQEKTVTVSVSDPAETSLVLTLQVNIPELFTIQPRFVMWKIGDAPEPKTITIHALHPEIVRPDAVEVKDERFSAELHPVDGDSTAFAVTITPRNTEVAMFTSATVSTRGAAEKKRVLQMFATVR